MGRNRILDDRKKLIEIIDACALGSQTFDRQTSGIDEYREYYFDAQGLQQLSDITGKPLNELQGIALGSDGFDDTQKAAMGLDHDYFEYVFDEVDLVSNLPMLRRKKDSREIER
jgi:hypothetical protein